MSADLPGNFLWGAATSAYQIEGAIDADGKSASIWDTFSHRRRKIKQGHNGDTACDHYRRMESDAGLMQQLGLHAYRFSLAWPRILPSLSSGSNARGLDFYNRLTDRLLAAGIRPFVTLYHWDLPQYLQDMGGWANRDIVRRYLADGFEVIDAESGRPVAGIIDVAVQRGVKQEPPFHPTPQKVTVTFAGIVAAQVANVFACRSDRFSAFQLGWTSNPLVLLGIAVELTILLVMTYSPLGHLLLGTAALPAWIYGPLALGAIGLLLADGFKKAVSGRMRTHQAG